MQANWKAWLTAFVVLLTIFFGLIAVTYVGEWMQPQVPKWTATYPDTQQPAWCAHGYINDDQCDIVEAPYKDGYLYQIWYDNTVFWHYETEYKLPRLAVFTNGDWTLMVESKDFKGGYR
ncbi:MAG: hypothetical protein KBT28_01695 [Bacteroidales bacterium]|nr:hypothetical protein [Candidatus Colimorpha merdihippi]